MATSHYPTSAELAAFRRSIATPSMAADPFWVCCPSPESGAWSHERERGIGYRDRGSVFDDIYYPAVTARREASRMRTAAFARMAV